MSYAHNATNCHRVFIVEDHPRVRRALSDFLSGEPDLEVAGEAASAEEALVKLGNPAPDLCLIDFSLPGIDGAELIRRLSRTHPDMRCLMVSSHHEQFYIDTALAAGARGYVLKGEPDALLRAITGALRGETVVEVE